jgi:ribonuclease HIII
MIFKVIKKENSICLTYLNIAEEEIKVKNLPYLSRLYHKKNEKIIDELIMIYSKKYNEKNVIFPNTNKINGTVYNNIIRKEYEEKEIFRTLSNYNLNQSCYKIFDDSLLF